MSLWPRRRCGRPERWLYRLVGIGVAYRAITTYSRGGFLACGAMLIVSVLRSRHKVRSALAIAVVALTVTSVMPQRFWDRMSTITTSEEDLSDTSSVSRLHFWRVARLMVADHPFLGVGHNAFNKAYDKYDFSLGLYGEGRSVHSIWFGVASELGIPAFVLYLLILGLAVWRVPARRHAGEARRSVAGAWPVCHRAPDELLCSCRRRAPSCRFNTKRWYGISSG